MSSRTNLGPLTTSFTYPSSCSVVVESCAGCSSGWQAQTCSNNDYNTQGVQDDVECWPPRANPTLSTGVALNGWGFYSPGIYCPVGYSSACSATGSVNGGFSFQFSLLQSETAVGCCPSGFTCMYKQTAGTIQAQTCQSIYSSGSFPAVQCSSGSSNGFSYQTVPATVTATTSGSSHSVATIPNFYVSAPLIQINYMATDLPSSTSQASTATPSSTSAAAAPPSGLSAGAEAGIGVGAGVVALGLLGIMWWLYRKKRKAKVLSPHDSDTRYEELSGDPSRHELSGDLSRQELSGDPGMHELSAVDLPKQDNHVSAELE